MHDKKMEKVEDCKRQCYHIFGPLNWSLLIFCVDKCNALSPKDALVPAAASEVKPGMKETAHATSAVL